MAVSIEKKYQKLTDTEHVLLRPGMYVGSIKPHTEEVFLPIKGKDQFQLTEVTYNPGFLKLFDEIISQTHKGSYSSRCSIKDADLKFIHNFPEPCC